MKTPEKVYQDIAQKLGELALQDSYVKTYIDGECDGLSYVFLCTAIAYTRDVLYPEGKQRELCDLVPMWWELHTYNSDGDEVTYWDFNFRELKNYIL